MKKMHKISGKVIPLNVNNVDTDLIIPAQYLTSISKQGYGENVFRRLRDRDPDFVFNQQKYRDASILVSKENFGCGSSREHAVWALQQAGIEVVIAMSFADIFFNNAAKNSLVLIKQSEPVIKQIMQAAIAGDCHIDIDLIEQKLAVGTDQFTFEIDPFHQYCFTHGLDELDYLLSHLEIIEKFRRKSQWQ